MSKKGRRVAYTCLSFKAQENSLKLKPDARDPVKSHNTIEPCIVQEWMERSFCEGDKADFTAKKQLWMKFQMEMQAKEDTKSVFFSLLENTIFKNPPFLKVTGVKREGKVSHYQYLKERSNSTQKKLKIATHEAEVSKYCQDDQVKVTADEEDCQYLPVKTDEEMVEATMGYKSVETLCHFGVLKANFLPQPHDSTPSPQTMLDFMSLELTVFLNNIGKGEGVWVSM